VIGTGQEVADVFIGAAWTQFSESEFVGGLADVYRNRQGGTPPMVNTDYGKLRGIVSLTSRNRSPYSAFMGVPFAKPPLNHLRFKVHIRLKFTAFTLTNGAVTTTQIRQLLSKEFRNFLGLL